MQLHCPGLTKLDIIVVVMLFPHFIMALVVNVCFLLWREKLIMSLVIM